MVSEARRKRSINLDNKTLMIVLGVFLALIFILGGLVIWNATHPPEEPVASTDEDEEFPLYWEGMSDEEYQEAKLIEESRNIDIEVKKLLSENPVDVDQINRLYEGGIKLAESQNRPDIVLTLNRKRKDNFLSKGMTKEALDGMLTMKFDSYSGPDQYRLYSDVIELAKALGDERLVSEYETKRKAVEASYQDDYNATKEASERSDDFDPGVVPEEEDDEEDI